MDMLRVISFTEIEEWWSVEALLQQSAVNPSRDKAGSRDKAESADCQAMSMMD